ncbi:MAG: hypothetical protein C4527_16430 [Candidatus Omnitrophota bacterium]|jgi:type II secretion system protein G|nr:MAG: hypothetical protein C4527_16430 [Candidatus Omnitrophota bacterium]
MLKSPTGKGSDFLSPITTSDQSKFTKIPKLFLVLFCLFLLFVACGNQNHDAAVLDTYRVFIAGKECSFDLQMLYLITVLELYRLHVGAYPSNENHLEALVAQPTILEGTGEWRGPYVDSEIALRDPWGNKFFYQVIPPSKVDLRSLGADGVESTDDITAAEKFPDWYREMEKLSQYGSIPLQPQNPSNEETMKRQ